MSGPANQDLRVLEQGASELFDRLYDAFGGRHWPVGELHVATCAFFDMVFKSTLLEVAQTDGDAALDEARAGIVELLGRLSHEIQTADRASLRHARDLFTHLRDPRR